MKTIHKTFFGPRIKKFINGLISILKILGVALLNTLYLIFGSGDYYIKAQRENKNFDHPDPFDVTFAIFNMQNHNGRSDSFSAANS